MKKKYRIAASLGAVLFPSAVISTAVISSFKNTRSNSNTPINKKIVQNNILNYGEKISDSNKNYEFWILDQILQKEKRSALKKNLFGLDKNLDIPGKPSFSVKKDSNNYNPEILHEYIIELNLINTKKKFDLIINEIYNQIYGKIRDSNKTFGLDAKKINSQKIIITAYEMQDNTSLTSFSKDFLQYVKLNNQSISKQFKNINLENIENLFESEIELFSNEKILNPSDFFKSPASEKHFENSHKINFDEENLIYNEKIVVTYSKDFNPLSNSLEINFNFYELSSNTVFEDNINKDFFIYKPKDSLTANSQIKLQQDQFIYNYRKTNSYTAFSSSNQLKIVKSLVILQKRVKNLISGNKAFKNKFDILNLKAKNPKIANLIIDGMKKIINIDFSDRKEVKKIITELFHRNFKIANLSGLQILNFINEASNLSKISCNPKMLKFIFLTNFLTAKKDYEKINFREVKDSVSVINILRYASINSLPAWYTLKHPAKSLVEIISYKLAKPDFDFDSLFFHSFNKKILKKILKSNNDNFFNEILYEIFATFTNDFKQFKIFIETVIKENNQVFEKIINSNNYQNESYDKKLSLFFMRIFSDKKYHKISRDEDSVFKMLLKGLKIKHDSSLKNFGAIIKTIGNFDFLPKLLKRYLVPNIKNKKWLSNLYNEGKFLLLYEVIVEIKENGLVEFMANNQKVDQLINLLKSLEVKTLLKNRVDKEVDLSIEGLLGTIKQMIQKPMIEWNQIFEVEDDISKIGTQDPNLAFNKLMKVFLIFEEDIDEGIVKRFVNERKSFVKLFNLIINFMKLKKTDDVGEKFMSNFIQLLDNPLFVNSDIYKKIHDFLSNASGILGESGSISLVSFTKKLLFQGFKDANSLYGYFLNFLGTTKSELEEKLSGIQDEEMIGYHKKLYIHNFLVCFIKLIFKGDASNSNIEVITIDGEDKETYESNYQNGILSLFHEQHLSESNRTAINIFKKIFKKGLILLKKWHFNYLINHFKNTNEIIPEILANNSFLSKNLIPIFTSMFNANVVGVLSESALSWMVKSNIKDKLESSKELQSFLNLLKNNFLFEILNDILNNNILNISEDSKNYLDKKMNFPKGTFNAIFKLITSSFSGITKQEFKNVFQSLLNSIEKIAQREPGSSKLLLSLEKNITIICDAMYGAD